MAAESSRQDKLAFLLAGIESVSGKLDQAAQCLSSFLPHPRHRVLQEELQGCGQRNRPVVHMPGPVRGAAHCLPNRPASAGRAREPTER